MKKSFIVLFIIITVQILVYFSFIRSYISTWGATINEVNTTLPGDKIAPYVISTRAINIKTNNSKVWNVLTGLGADREGFFAYTFLEKILGYKTIASNTSKSTMKVGRIIPTTVNGNKKYSFPIIEIQDKKYFVLKNWGTFLLKKIDSTETRLIIRTHGKETSTSKNEISNLIFEPLHYIMEKRMLLGIQAKCENKKIEPTKDILWFIGIVFSAFGIILIIFKYTNFIAIILTFILSNIWLCALLVINPLSFFSSIFLIIVLVIYILLKVNANKTLEKNL